MISRVALAIAAVAASVGLLIYGMGTSYSPENHDMKKYGLIMLIAGTVGIVVFAGWYRMVEASEEAAARAKYGEEPR